MKTCYTCQHFKNSEPNGPRKDMWYNHLCKAAPLDVTINPVTGEACCKSRNDLGQEYYTNQMFEYCREINKGDCSLWIAKAK